MLWKTHLIIAFLAGLFLLPVLVPQNQILYIALILFASLLPDIDHPDSAIGKKVKIVAFLFEHRGFFHSIFALILLTLPFMALKLEYIAWPLGIGYLSHILADALTLQGIMFLHPLLRWKIKGFIKSGGFIEKILFLILFFVLVWKLFTR